MKSKNQYLKYAIIVLGILFLVTAALLGIQLWEKQQGRFDGDVTESGVLTYGGEKYVLKEGLETFLVMGLDKYEGESASDSHGTGVQADFLMLFVFDNTTKQVQAIHIDRDTMTAVNRLGIGGIKTDSFISQIALAYNYVQDSNDKIRCGNTKDAVETLLHGVKVKHYLSVTMDAVVAVNDLVGGVEVEVLDDFTGIDDTLIKGERVTLQGEQALRYVRTRYGLDDSTNNARMARQQQYIDALYAKVLACNTADGEFALKLVDAVSEYVAYDSTNQRMQQFAEKLGEYEFLGIRELPGESQKTEEFMEFYPDEEALLELVVEVFYVPQDK